jgi:hypothetical protein
VRKHGANERVRLLERRVVRRALPVDDEEVILERGVVPTKQ